jgi:hypothetical protein
VTVANAVPTLEWLQTRWEEMAPAIRAGRLYPPSGPAASAAQTSATFRVSNNASWVRSAVSKRVQPEAAVASPRQELRDYFDSPRVNCPDNTLDVFAWWRVSHAMLPSHSPLPMMLIPLPSFIQQHTLRYPTLARVARDFLAIQGSAVKCERAFSSSGQTVTDRRSSLHPKTVGALQILKSAYANNHISADEEAPGRASR